GASVPEEFAEVCAAHQMPAMALLDRDGVYGSPRFYFAAKKLNIKAHIGAEITSLLSPIMLSKRSGAPSMSLRVPSPPANWERVGAAIHTLLPRVSLLCASRTGYQNLCRLITRTKLRAPKYPTSLPRHSRFSDDLILQSQAVASLSDLAEFAEGLI